MPALSTSAHTPRELLLTGDVHAARAAAEAVIADESMEPRARAEAGIVRGWALLAVGEPEAALESFAESVEGARETEAEPLTVEALAGYAYCFLAEDPLAPAHGLVSESLARATKLGDPGMLALALRAKGAVAMARCKFDEAEGAWTAALEYAMQAGDRRQAASAHERLATLLRAVGRPAAALGHAERALTLARETGDRRREAEALLARASALAAQGRRVEAASSHASAQTLLDALTLRMPVPRTVPEQWRRLYAEARALRALGRIEQAAHQARELAREVAAVPPLLPMRATPDDVLRERAGAMALCGDLRALKLADGESRAAAEARQLADDRVALLSVSGAPAAVQMARRARVQCQAKLARARHRFLLMRYEVPAGAIATATAALAVAWQAERAAHHAHREVTPPTSP